MKKIIVFVTLNINWECVETVHQSFISEFLLPLSPLIIEDIVKRRNCVSLLPLIQEVDISRRRIKSMQLSLSTENVL